MQIFMNIINGERSHPLKYIMSDLHIMKKWEGVISAFELEQILKNVVSVFKENNYIAMYYVYHKLE